MIADYNVMDDKMDDYIWWLWKNEKEISWMWSKLIFNIFIIKGIKINK